MFERDKLAGYFAIAAGLGIVAWWLVDLTIGNAAGTLTLQDWFHIAAEAITAATLLVAGSRIVRERPGARRLYLAASGMLIYATVTGAGIFAFRGLWAMTVVLLAVAIATALFGVDTALSIDRESR